MVLALRVSLVLQDQLVRMEEGQLNTLHTHDRPMHRVHDNIQQWRLIIRMRVMVHIRHMMVHTLPGQTARFRSRVDRVLMVIMRLCISAHRRHPTRLPPPLFPLSLRPRIHIIMLPRRRHFLGQSCHSLQRATTSPRTLVVTRRILPLASLITRGPNNQLLDHGHKPHRPNRPLDLDQLPSKRTVPFHQ